MVVFLVKPSLEPPQKSHQPTPTDLPKDCGAFGHFPTCWRQIYRKNARYPPGYPNILLMAGIRRSPVEVGSLSHYLQGFIHLRWLFGISEPSTVSHQTGSSRKIIDSNQLWVGTRIHHPFFAPSERHQIHISKAKNKNHTESFPVHLDFPKLCIPLVQGEDHMLEGNAQSAKIQKKLPKMQVLVVTDLFKLVTWTPHKFVNDKITLLMFRMVGEYLDALR